MSSGRIGEVGTRRIILTRSGCPNAGFHRTVTTNLGKAIRPGILDAMRGVVLEISQRIGTTIWEISPRFVNGTIQDGTRMTKTPRGRETKARIIAGINGVFPGRTIWISILNSR
jgi:hypothetical protein